MLEPGPRRPTGAWWHGQMVGDPLQHAPQRSIGAGKESCVEKRDVERWVKRVRLECLGRCLWGLPWLSDSSGVRWGTTLPGGCG